MKKLFLRVAVILMTFAIVASCKKYDKDIEQLDKRITALESATASLKAAFDAGAYIRSVTPLANNAGYRVEFTGGVPAIDIFHGTNGTNGTAGTVPRIEPRYNDDGTVTLWVDTGTGMRNSGIDLKGPQGEPGQQGEQGITPEFKIDENDDGELTIWVRFGNDPWQDLGVDLYPDGDNLLLAIIDNLDGTVTFMLNDDPDFTEYTFAKASTVVRFEIAMVAEKIIIASGSTGKLYFRANPSTAWIPTTGDGGIANWYLDQLGTRSPAYLTPSDFSIVSIEEDLPGQYIATIEDNGANPGDTYVLALILEAEPGIYISSPTFLVSTIDAEARIGSDYYEFLYEALAAVNTDETITMLKNITSADSIVVGGGKPNFTLDLDGYTLSMTTNLAISTSGIKVTAGGEFNLISSTSGGVFNLTTGSSGSGTGINVAGTGSSVNIDGATLNISAGNYGVYAQSGSAVTLDNGGVFNASGGSAGIVANGGSTVMSTSAVCTDNPSWGVFAQGSGTEVTVTGNVEANGSGTSTSGIVHTEVGGKITVGGDVIATGTGSTGAVANSGIIVIGGTIITLAGDATATGALAKNDGDITVNCTGATDADKKIFTDGIYIVLDTDPFAIEDFTSDDIDYLYYEDGTNSVKVAAPTPGIMPWNPIVSPFSGNTDGATLRSWLFDNLDKHLALDGNINITGGNPYNWSLAGVGPLTGSLDGRGNTITGLGGTQGQDRGLYHTIAEGAVVKNLNFDYVRLNNGSACVGTVAAYNNGLIENCTVTSIGGTSTLTGGNAVGGIVGRNLETGVIKNCTANAAVTSNSGNSNINGAGGIAGLNLCTVENCTAHGAILNSANAGTGTNGGAAGGIVGRNLETGTVKNCAVINASVVIRNSSDVTIGRVVGVNLNTDPGALSGNSAAAAVGSPSQYRFNSDNNGVGGTSHAIVVDAAGKDGADAI